MYNRSVNITLQRRHGPACAGARKKGSYTFEPDERRRGNRPCDCPIYACGTLDGLYKRQPTRQRSWADAEKVLAPYLAAGSWEPLEPTPPPPAKPPKTTAQNCTTSAGIGPAATENEARLTIDDAIEACYREHKSAQSADSTIRAYRTVFDEFRRMSASLGFRWLDEWRPTQVRALRASWKCSARTARKKIGYLKSFFELFVEDETIPSNPARIKAHINRALRGDAQKKPYTDRELERMLEECRKTHVAKSKVVAIRERSFTGNDLADFIEISCYTGLRISDVVSFDVSRLTERGEVKMRCLKNGNPVCVWIPEWLRATIQFRARTVGPRIFGAGNEGIERTCVKWRRRLMTLWKKTGPWTSPPTHHRFRHTFVRRLLEQGVSVAIVAELIGDTEQMVRRSYSAWIESRQEAMTQVLEKAFANAPRYHR